MSSSNSLALLGLYLVVITVLNVHFTRAERSSDPNSDACDNCWKVGTKQCNRLTETCECISQLTLGERCDSCIVGAYMHPRDGCTACDQCPVTGGGNGTCVYDPVELMTCNCVTGYTGKHCSVCANGYYKDGSTCLRCNCSINQNIEVVKRCYENTGDCKSCLFTVSSTNLCDYCLNDYQGENLHLACLGQKSNMRPRHYITVICVVGLIGISCAVLALFIYRRYGRTRQTRNYLRQHMQYDSDKVKFSTLEEEREADFYLPKHI